MLADQDCPGRCVEALNIVAKFFHGTYHDDLVLRDTQQSSTQWGVALSPWLGCARNFGDIILIIEVPEEKTEFISCTRYSNCHWSDNCARVAKARDCTIVNVFDLRTRREV